MKGSWLSIALAGMIVAGCGTDTPATDDDTTPRAEEASATLVSDVSSSVHERLLTAEDVARVTGFSGVHAVSRNPAVGAGGDLNFAREGEQLVLMAMIQPASYFEKVGPMMADPVAGLGDKALDGPAHGPKYSLVFRKGDRAVSLSSFLDLPSGQPLLGQQQLMELARIIEGRL